ncbi:MAG: chromate resistance protein [Nitrospirae bacterium]|nr:chromate resistance protein [Nitrospirota bacterium]MBI3377560.1 chromate resistance protein [Nitrospirota bacterium]
MIRDAKSGWLFFFYSVPSKPVSSRMKIWRRLSKAGAIQLKGAVYALPYSEEHYEFFQWLVSEVASMKGDAAFVRVENIETMKNSEIISLFNQQREKDYSVLMKNLEELERRINSVRKGGGTQNNKKLMEQMARIRKEFEGIQAVDFFSSKAGENLKKNIKELESGLKGISGHGVKEQKVTLTQKRAEDYQSMTWATRKRPFVDRMASAWLIKKFIDKNAVFRFIDEKDIDSLGKGVTAFDVRDGEFTHIGEMCTFEVLVKSFNLKDKTLRKIAEIVHELDIKDGKYSNAEAKGIEGLLSGIRKTAKADAEALEKGMEAFEMLYASKT